MSQLGAKAASCTTAVHLQQCRLGGRDDYGGRGIDVRGTEDALCPEVEMRMGFTQSPLRTLRSRAGVQLSHCRARSACHSLRSNCASTNTSAQMMMYLSLCQDEMNKGRRSRKMGPRFPRPTDLARHTAARSRPDSHEQFRAPAIRFDAVSSPVDSCWSHFLRSGKSCVGCASMMKVDNEGYNPT